jgi:hypothetical protein
LTEYDSYFHYSEVVRLVGLFSSDVLSGAIGAVAGDTDYNSTGIYIVDLKSPAAAVVAHPSGVSLGAINLTRMPICALSDCDEIGKKLVRLV